MANSLSRKNKWVLTEPALHKLLAWLDADPGRAGQKYEDIRRSLILFFESRGCLTAQDQTDETIDRVTRRIDEGVDVRTDNRFLYFYGVAVRVFQEYARTAQRPAPPPPLPEDPRAQEARVRCMERCLDTLPAEVRALVTAYCQANHTSRKQMAEQLGLSVSSLRVRVHRVREQLGSCVARCMSAADAPPEPAAAPRPVRRVIT